MRYTPMTCTPMRFTRMTCTPMRYTPVRCTLVRYAPMRCTPDLKYGHVGNIGPSPGRLEGHWYPRVLGVRQSRERMLLRRRRRSC
jgi:hypothetical protein